MNIFLAVVVLILISVIWKMHLKQIEDLSSKDREIRKLGIDMDILSIKRDGLTSKLSLTEKKLQAKDVEMKSIQTTSYNLLNKNALLQNEIEALKKEIADKTVLQKVKKKVVKKTAKKKSKKA